MTQQGSWGHSNQISARSRRRVVRCLAYLQQSGISPVGPEYATVFPPMRLYWDGGEYERWPHRTLMVDPQRLHSFICTVRGDYLSDEGVARQGDPVNFAEKGSSSFCNLRGYIVPAPVDLAVLGQAHANTCAAVGSPSADLALEGPRHCDTVLLAADSLGVCGQRSAADGATPGRGVGGELGLPGRGPSAPQAQYL